MELYYNTIIFFILTQGFTKLYDKKEENVPKQEYNYLLFNKLNNLFLSSIPLVPPFILLVTVNKSSLSAKTFKLFFIPEPYSWFLYLELYLLIPNLDFLLYLNQNP